MSVLTSITAVAVLPTIAEIVTVAAFTALLYGLETASLGSNKLVPSLLGVLQPRVLVFPVSSLRGVPSRCLEGFLVLARLAWTVDKIFALPTFPSMSFLVLY